MVAPTEAAALSAAYAERLRLGLGSPFRLMEQALADERLGAAAGGVARMLLDRVERGALYEVGPLALIAAGVPEASAVAQHELIEQAVTSAPDARVGELAVNLAYELVAAERLLEPALVPRVARVAALLRDRELARADAQWLRATARRQHVAPEALVPGWRAARRFTVEQPTLVPLDASAQEEAARLALLLVGGIRATLAPVASDLQRRAAAPASILSPHAAAVLLRDSLAGAPQPALLVTLRALKAAALTEPTAFAAPHWQLFLDQATSEERLVAALVQARRTPADEVIAASVALDAAIALRPFAQESFGADSVSVQQLAERFGVRVRFDAEVTASQRAASLRALAAALHDLRGLLASMDLSGLTFAIGPIEAHANHLAYHEPRRRIIRLDPAMMAGTIAHEIAHDLDWQLAARTYRTRRSYATDYATRNGRALAFTVESLQPDAASLVRPGAAAAGASRPAEVFARRFEWYVASALALEGRSSGWLSSAQNDWIAGYGSAVRPDPAPAAVKSFADLIAGSARLDRTERARVEKVVAETSPIAVRLLMRAIGAPDRAAFQRQAHGELQAWTCGNLWHDKLTSGTAIRWYADALAAAVFPQTVAVLPDPKVALAPFGRARGGDVVALTALGSGSCSPLAGAVLARTVR